jgi:hypothetical protein
VHRAGVAPGYKPAEVTLSRGGPNQVKIANLTLERDEAPRFGRLQGSVRDGRTGRPVPGAVIFIDVGDAVILDADLRR